VGMVKNKKPLNRNVLYPTEVITEDNDIVCSMLLSEITFNERHSVAHHGAGVM